jgi:uncharacterized protein YegP (UPF0339 family)
VPCRAGSATPKRHRNTHPMPSHTQGSAASPTRGDVRGTGRRVVARQAATTRVSHKPGRGYHFNLVATNGRGIATSEHNGTHRVSLRGIKSVGGTPLRPRSRTRPASRRGSAGQGHRRSGAGETTACVTRPTRPGRAVLPTPVGLTAEEAAAVIGIARSSVYRPVLQGELPKSRHSKGGLGAEVDELACRPGSVSARLAATRSATIHLGLPLPTASCGLPADSGGPPSNVRADGRNHPLDLAPGGVYRAAPVTRNAGGLLHRRFTLTAAGAAAVCFLWHCPAGHPGWALPTTLPFGARTFLGESPPRGRPASSSIAKSRGRAAFAPTRR